MTHLKVLVWVEQAQPMVFRAVLRDTAFHDVLLDLLAVLDTDGFRFDVCEVEDGRGYVICRVDIVRGKMRVGAVVVDIEASDTVVIVVVSEEFT